MSAPAEASNRTVQAAVETVVEAVDGTYAGAGDKVRHLLEQNYTLSQVDVNRILAACAINDDDKDANEFAEEFNVKVPGKSYNQLQGNNNGCISEFLTQYEQQVRQAPDELLIRFLGQYEWYLRDRFKGLSVLLRMAPVVKGMDEKKLREIALKIILHWALDRGEGLSHKKEADSEAQSVSSFSSVRDNPPNTSAKKRDSPRESPADDNENGRAELVDRLKAKHVSVVTGSGVSMAIANPAQSAIMGWNGFLQALARSVQAFTGRDDAWFNETLGFVPPPAGQKHPDAFEQGERIKAAIAQLEAQMNPGAAVDYTRFVYPLYSLVRPSPQATSPSHESLAEAIRALHSPIATTNYDMLLEECLHRHEVNLLVHQPKDYQHILAGHEKAVYHLHGVWYDQRGFVLTQSEYADHAPQFVYGMLHLLDESPAIKNHCRSMLFIGCGDGLFDPHYLLLFKLLAEAHPDVLHYAIASGREAPNLRAKAKDKGITNLRIIPYGAQRSDLRPFLWRLALDAGFEKTEILRIRSGERLVAEVPAVPADDANGVAAVPAIPAHSVGFFESAELHTICNLALDPAASVPEPAYPICTHRRQLTEAVAQQVYTSFAGAGAHPASVTAPNAVWQSVRVLNGESRLLSSLRPQ